MLSLVGVVTVGVVELIICLSGLVSKDGKNKILFCFEEEDEVELVGTGVDTLILDDKWPIILVVDLDGSIWVVVVIKVIFLFDFSLMNEYVDCIETPSNALVLLLKYKNPLVNLGADEVEGIYLVLIELVVWYLDGDCVVDVRSAWDSNK